MTSRKKRPRDMNQLAKLVVERFTIGREPDFSDGEPHKGKAAARERRSTATAADGQVPPLLNGLAGYVSHLA
jgi:hypothetical protein